MFSNVIGSSLKPYLIGSLIFLLIYFIIMLKFVSKKLKLTSKLFLYTLPFTLIFMVYLSMFLTASINGLYSSIYAANINSINGILNNAVANYNPQIVGSELGNVFTSNVASINPFTFSNGIMWLLLAVLIYFICLLIVFLVVLKPIKAIQKNTFVLASGGEIKNLNLKGKEFFNICENLLKIQANNLSLKNELARIKADFYKILPKQAVQLIGKKDLSEVASGNYIQKSAYLLNVYLNFSEELDDITKLNKANKYFAQISPTLRNFNGVIFSYNLDKTECLFSSKNSLDNAVKALNNINLDNPELNLVPETKMVTIGVVGYNKQYSVTLIN